MKLKKWIPMAFGAAGAVAAAAAVCLSLVFMNEDPVLLTPPNLAKSQAAAMMNAVCNGDYGEASEYILGNPDLGVNREASDAVGVMIWDSFTGSLSYEMVGPCYTTDEGLAQQIELTGLDIESVTADLKNRSQALLAQRVEEAEDTSEIYDEGNDYKEEFVMDVLYDAVTQAIAEDSVYQTVTLTLNLTYQNGRWWVVADNELLDAISGGILY